MEIRLHVRATVKGEMSLLVGRYALPHFIPAITSDQAISGKIKNICNLLALTTSTTTVVRSLDDTS